MPWLLPQGGEHPDPCLDKLLLVSQVPYIKEGPLFYAKVCFGWLSLQTQERVLLNTSKEDICNVKGEMVETGYVPYLEGLAQIWGR